MENKPRKPVIYGYARCSTNETKQDVERQKRELKRMGATAETIYSEYESGTRLNRPELAKLMGVVREGDTIVTTEVSRMTRSTRQLCDLIDIVKEKKLKLVIGTFVIDCRGVSMEPMNEAMLKLMGVFSELEREMTIERIKSGLAHAKAKGVRLGRPALTADRIPKKVVEMFPFYRDRQITKTDYAKLCGVSRQTIYKYIEIMTDS